MLAIGTRPPILRETVQDKARLGTASPKVGARGLPPRSTYASVGRSAESETLIRRPSLGRQWADKCKPGGHGSSLVRRQQGHAPINMVNIVDLDGSPLTGTTTGKYDVEDKYSSQFNPVLITIGALFWFEDLGHFLKKLPHAKGGRRTADYGSCQFFQKHWYTYRNRRALLWKMHFRFSSRASIM